MMRISSCLLGVIVWSVSHGAAGAQDLSVFCGEVARAAVTAAQLRDSGATSQAAVQQLQNKFSAEVVQAGTNTAFAYKQLKEYAISDFAMTYCEKMIPSNGKPTDFDLLWVRTHYERAVECASRGQVEREPFEKCWVAQQARDAKGNERVILSTMNLEYILAEKRSCEVRFPMYTAQNKQAFLASVLANVSSEAMIDTYAGIGAKHGLLRGLANLRQKSDSGYLSMGASEFEARCEKFARLPELRQGK